MTKAVMISGGRRNRHGGGGREKKQRLSFSQLVSEASFGTICCFDFMSGQMGQRRRVQSSVKMGTDEKCIDLLSFSEWVASCEEDRRRRQFFKEK